ncbi:PhzF family phenazine biosynthesis protein [Aliidiomarina sp. Khilg15.8]
MKLTMYQVDAFTTRVFGGNPAAVLVLDDWLSDAELLAIADENNLSETAFLVASDEADSDYQLRWFTPAAEVDLCGHATLAAAHVLFAHVGVTQESLRFSTRSGILVVRRGDDNLITMDFPAASLQEVSMPASILRGIGVTPLQVYKAYDYIAVLPTEADVRGLKPDFAALRELDGRGVVVTAKGEQCDFVSRCFFPKLRVDEDPVTGSAHCELAPLWAEKLAKKELTGIQLSSREGQINCIVDGSRVQLSGNAVTYLSGEIFI